MLFARPKEANPVKFPTQVGNSPVKKFDERSSTSKFLNPEISGILPTILFIEIFRTLRLLHWLNSGGMFPEIEFEVRTREVRPCSLHKEGEISPANDALSNKIPVTIPVSGSQETPENSQAELASTQELR